MTVTDASTPLLQLQDVSRHFAGLRAVDGVSFALAEGEVLSIIGPNGSGKTTTLNLVAGALAPDEGEILLFGQRIDGRDPASIAEAGIARTFQNGRVFGALTVSGNVEAGLHTTLAAARPFRRLSSWFGLRWIPLLAELALALLPTPAVRRERAATTARVDAELDRFGQRLRPRREDFSYTLSYANRRRTEIARALATAPRLLVLDEPTAGMNQSETAEVLEQLLALKAEGQSMLLVEHKLDLVMTVSDRVIVMDSGRIIAEGTPAEVRRDPAVVEAYLGRRWGLGGEIAGEVQGEDAPQGDGGGASDGIPLVLSGANPSGAPDAAPPARATARSGESDPGVPLRDENGQSPTPLLELDAVDVFYGAFHALRGVSLTVGAGEIVSLLGGNASGKSTTMKTVLGLNRLRAGSLRLDGRDIAPLPTPSRVAAGIASVPEARRIFPQLTVDENLLAGAYTRRDRAGVVEDLERMRTHFPRLAERRRQEAGTLSGGEQQMLAFARALMSRPRLICMDEPTMGLSPKLVDQVLDEIVRLNAELGVAVLLVEQQAELAL